MQVTNIKFDLFTEIITLIFKDANITQEQKKQIEKYISGNCKG